MSSYFDSAMRELNVENSQFISALSSVEDRVIRDVNLVTGDREFPEDLREKIQGIIAVHRYNPPEGCQPSVRAREYDESVKTSRMINTLHDAFHDVATRKIETRFGLLTDNPRNILARRDAMDTESK